LAGLGRKEFNSGDILLASEVQGYLQDQAVMVFDDATARGSAIASPSEGMVTYTKDDDAIQVYDGSDFVGVGSDSGLIHIETVSFASLASQSINDVFSATYDNYLILVKSSCSAATQLNLRMRVGGSDLSSSSYMYGGVYVEYNGSAAVVGENATGTPGGASSAGFNILDVDGNPGYARLAMFDPFATEQTGILYEQSFNSGGSRNSGYYEAFSGLTTVTTSFTGFTLLPATGNITGTVSVYGYKK
jgi:hypothetical protein